MPQEKVELQKIANWFQSKGSHCERHPNGIGVRVSLCCSERMVFQEKVELQKLRISFSLKEFIVGEKKLAA